MKHWARLAISGKLPDRSDLVGPVPRFLYVWAAIGLALMVMLARPV
jgi:hypothetical protein